MAVNEKKKDFKLKILVSTQILHPVESLIYTHLFTDTLPIHGY